MSKEISPFRPQPAAIEHEYRRADIDARAAKRAERQVALMFAASAFFTVLFVVAFATIDATTVIGLPVFGPVYAFNVAIGVTMGLAIFFIGAGAIHWAKKLMPDQEVIALRHEMRSEESDRQEFVKTAKAGAEQAGLGRRPLIKRTLAAAAGLAGLPAVILLRDLGPLPKNSLNETSWKSGTRLVTDPGDRPIRPADLEVGAVAQVMPELSAGKKRTLEDVAKDAVLLIRLRPSEFQLDDERLSWTYQGIIAFSKICSHMGCAVALYEQTTKHLLCPCHQSTFDVTRAAKVIFGPAARPLPQLAITVDSEGYLVAKQPFTEAVGPSFWERKS